MAEATACAVGPAEVAVVPIQPPPYYVLALAWRHGERAAAAHQFLSYLRSYRDRHSWTATPNLRRPTALATQALNRVSPPTGGGQRSGLLGWDRAPALAMMRGWPNGGPGQGPPQP